METGGKSLALFCTATCSPLRRVIANIHQIIHCAASIRIFCSASLDMLTLCSRIGCSHPPAAIDFVKFESFEHRNTLTDSRFDRLNVSSVKIASDYLILIVECAESIQAVTAHVRF